MPRIIKINPQSPDEDLLKEVAASIRSGKIIIYPTETFYGLGALYSDDNALKLVFQIKVRDNAKPLPLLLPDKKTLDVLAGDVSETSSAIANKFWPGPLTLLLPASPKLSPFLTGKDGLVGCRVSSSIVVQRLLHFLRLPITTTSANLAGEKSPARIDDISKEVIDSVDIILDGGDTPGGLPSTIIDVSVTPFTLVRPGAVPFEKIYEDCRYLVQHSGNNFYD